MSEGDHDGARPDDPLDARLMRLLHDQLTPEERTALQKDAKSDPELRRQLEAFRPLPSDRLADIAAMGHANRRPAAPGRQRAGRLWAWATVAGLSAVGVTALVIVGQTPPLDYQLEASGTSPGSVAFDAPLRYRFVPTRADTPRGFVRAWAQTKNAASNDSAVQVDLPVRRTADGTIELRSPAHRLTGGKFGPVELTFAISGSPRPDTEERPRQTTSHVQVHRTQLVVGPPPYLATLYRPTRNTTLRSSDVPAEGGRITIEVRPEVPVHAGLTVHLYVVENGRAKRLPARGVPIGTQGVLRFDLEPETLPHDPTYSAVIAVGPSLAALPPEQVWSVDHLAEPPAGWRFETLKTDAPEPKP